jgi:hypothetical protein
MQSLFIFAIFFFKAAEAKGGRGGGGGGRGFRDIIYCIYSFAVFKSCSFI